MTTRSNSPQLDISTADRLVIRIHLTSQDPPRPPPPRKRLSRAALLLSLLVVVVLLGWLGVNMFKPDQPARVASAPVVSTPPVSPPAATTPEVRQPPDQPPSPVNEVIPDVPQSALDTIWGTVRVGIRVTIDKQGSVIEAVAEDRGPSRYFERLSLEASKKWTFTPATADGSRTVLVKFHYTRDGATAHASPVQ